MSIRGIDPDLYRWLKMRAADHDRSMEAEAREIFAESRRAEESAREDMSLGAFLGSLSQQYGCFDDLELPLRDEPARAYDFSDWELQE